jgi:beta-lactamase class A
MPSGHLATNRLVGAAAALVVGLGVLAVPTVRPAAAAPRPAAGRVSHGSHCGTMFPAALEARWQREFPGRRVTAAVYDTRTHCWYHLHRTVRITTASVIKAQVLGAVLLRAQGEGRGLDGWERHRVHPMIEYSLNDPYVSDLYEEVGGVAGMNSFDRRMGATHTTNTLEYGATVTTALDRTRIALKMLHGGGPLHRAARRTAWHYMAHVVTPTQRWGITAGVPADWRVALKNGFYPIPGIARWRVGSTGFARSPGGHGGYAVTIMTDRNATQHQGIRLVERVSRRAASFLTAGPPAPRIVSRAQCVTTHAGESWRTVAHRVGEPRSAWAKVRLVSGGNPDPLQGQRACSPRLRPRS